MVTEQYTYEWLETEEGLVVRFPPPPLEQHSTGCAIVFLVIAVSALAVVPVMLLLRIVDGVPTGLGLGAVYIAVIAISWIFLLYALWMYRESRLPPPVIEPSIVSVSDGVLKIERGGRRRDMDYSWDRAEIVDVRLGAEGPEQFTLKTLLPLNELLPKQYFIRFSVEDTSGQVNDVLIEAPGMYWTFELEPRLRAHLGLQPDRNPRG